jgi:hypothetical protein
MEAPDSRPRFVDEIQNVSINAGDEAEFNAVATGKPTPGFKW